MNEPRKPTALLQVDGMTCQNCARHVREAAESVPGVAGASVDLDAGRVRLRWSGELDPDPEAVRDAIVAAGFRAAPIEETETEPRPRRAGSAWLPNVLLGGAATAFFILAEWVLGWMHQPWFPWLGLAVATPVQFIAGARFYRGAWNQLRQGASNMDTLVSLGSTAAYGFSLWVIASGSAGHHVYFMESTAIIALISIGHWLEALATERAAGALRSLLNLAPPRARRLTAQEIEEEVLVSELVTGDRVVIRPGDRVPTDARVEEGASALDESMLTGESRPVEKSVGAVLYAGTANADGRLVARVTATGDRTVLAHIAAAIERAQNSRAGIQRLADQVSSVFVPIVVLLAVLAALAWGLAPDFTRGIHDALAPWLWRMPVSGTPLEAALLSAISVLIVACPCAMGLATPAAIMAGTNVAASRGILIRDGVALEKAGRIRSVVFDKTGTLTEGRLTVGAILDLRSSGDGAAPKMGRQPGPESEAGLVSNAKPRTETTRTLPAVDVVESVEKLAASLARNSQHPVSRALAALGPSTPAPVIQPFPGLKPAGPSAGRAGAFSPGMPLRADLAFVPRRPAPATGWSEWRELRGRGIEASRGSGPVYRLGSPTWLHECGVVDAGAEQGGAVARGGAVTLVGLAADQRLLALFELKDRLRPEAQQVVSDLHRDGFDVYLLTGDGWLAAESVAREAGISSTHVLADVKPEQKASSLKRLQSEGRRVAFVGDGLNDGPALAQADLGMAVSRATDVARESADVVLIRGGLGALREALDLSQATLRTIRQNLFWAFFYNAAAVPLAMLGFFTPVVCALAMGLSDLIVIGNALRLRSWKPRSREPGR